MKTDKQTNKKVERNERYNNRVAPRSGIISLPREPDNIKSQGIYKRRKVWTSNRKES